MVAAPVLTLPNSPPTEEGPHGQEGPSSRVGALSRASSFFIGNWRWSTWGSFREASQELVLATGCLFFALRRIAADREPH